MNTPNWIVNEGENLQVILSSSLLALLMLAEWLAPRRHGPMDRGLRWSVNFFLTAVNLVAMSLLPISFISASLWADAHGVGLLNYVRPPTVVLVAVTLLIRGLMSFVTHYLNHVVPLFWRVHRVHHLDTELDVSTTVRFHPLESVIGLLPGIPLVVAFGLTPWVLMAYELLDVVVTLWTHSNVRLPWPWTECSGT